MKKIFILLSTLCTTIGCETDSQNEVQEKTITAKKETLTVPFDTAQVLADLDITESVNKYDLIDKDSKIGLNESLDTIKLMYIAYACECQKWVNPVEYARVQEHNYRDRDNPGDDYIEFDLDKFGYYIEPADRNLEIADNSHVTGNVIKFIGKAYNDIGHPENSDFIMPAPEGKVFRYYSYEIQRPFHIWGPRIYGGVDSVTNEEIFAPNMLTIKND